MTTPEREALLKLWERVPECRPARWEPGTIDDLWPDVVAALARDAIVEWLHTNNYAVTTAEDAAMTDQNRRWLCGLDENRGDYREHNVYGPTRLLALIAAARAVKGLPPSAPSSPST